MFIRTKEVMEILCVSRSTIDNYINKGILIAYRLDGITLFKRDEVIWAVEKGKIYPHLQAKKTTTAKKNIKNKTLKPPRPYDGSRNWLKEEVAKMAEAENGI